MTISVCMPFWRRQTVLAANLAQYRNLYPKADLEIVIADDGSPEPAEAVDHYPWPVNIIRLPAKSEALNPCVPLNAAVAASSGEFVLLTNPEVVHRTPILSRMRDVLLVMPRGHLAAACWSPSNGRWYCHTRKMRASRYQLPRGAGLHFCAMLRRSLFDQVGGFSEEYREGQAFEDADFLWKLDRAKAQFRIADYLVVDHVKTSRPKWPADGLARNQTIYERKWG